MSWMASECDRGELCYESCVELRECISLPALDILRTRSKCPIVRERKMSELNAKGNSEKGIIA
jgi:hypothetical protein